MPITTMFGPLAAISAARLMSWRKRFSSAMTWSEGNMPITAVGSRRARRNAARPIAGAVFRPTGSATICFLSSLLSCRTIASRRSSLVMTQKCFVLASGRSRSTVSWIMLFLLLSGSSCLAMRLRLSGQKRVPRPPARITG